MSLIYWFLIIFLLIAVILTVVYIIVTRSKDECCYDNDLYVKSCMSYLTPSPAGPHHHGGGKGNCCDGGKVKTLCGDRDFYAMVICLGVILAIMLTVFILFIYMSGGSNGKTETKKPAAAVITETKPLVLPPPALPIPPPTEVLVLPPPIVSSFPYPEDYVRLGSLGCKKRSSCRKSPKFKIVTTTSP